MSKSYVLARLLAMLLPAAIAACASAPPAPRALLNEHTADTLTVVAEPLLFARVRTVTTDSGHDYATLVAMEKDAAGTYTDLLLLYRWSIPSYAATTPSENNDGQLFIQADEHAIELHPLDKVPVDLSQRKELFAPEHVDVATHAYAIDLDTLRLMASSHELTLRLSKEPADGSFWLWKDGRPALTLFIKQLTGS
jgi:hypothetical protein